jgi:ribosomal 30S subunit maturation factor RimM
LIPALRSIVAKVDLPGRKMLIRPIEGMVNTDDL